MKMDILDELAAEYGVFISDLRVEPRLNKAAVNRLNDMPEKQSQEWHEAMEYLAGCDT